MPLRYLCNIIYPTETPYFPVIGHISSTIISRLRLTYYLISLRNNSVTSHISQRTLLFHHFVFFLTLSDFIDCPLFFMFLAKISYQFPYLPKHPSLLLLLEPPCVTKQHFFPYNQCISLYIAKFRRSSIYSCCLQYFPSTTRIYLYVYRFQSLETFHRYFHILRFPVNIPCHLEYLVILYIIQSLATLPCHFCYFKVLFLPVIC